MSKEVLIAIISASGVIFSAILACLISYLTVKWQKRKALYEFEATYLNNLISCRIESYKNVYFILSNLFKDKTSRGVYPGRRVVDRNRIVDFIKEYDELNSKEGVLFSGLTGNYSHRFRLFIYEVLSQTSNENFYDYFTDEIEDEFYKKGLQLESSLKSDIGVYVLEHKDFDRKINIRTYAQLVREREKCNKL
ncbi:hypothetical protein [Marinifilum caeruleilacunae]|uniref:Phage abortive infection protein n=1 Tax=Marinifilum caeruleilacunae TaxID=2499076 RepID=A0ABX1WWV0_9BACT|nr:hypothetical protein [Marinifilum caeruleilacunae]NOU60596.1 hypothetical protein [Marinifilum caeruleilacunae]